MKKFTREELLDLEIPWMGVGKIEEGIEILEDKIIGTGRWDVRKEAIFTYENHHYRLRYSLPATELQECDPFRHGDPDCVEVWPVEIKVVKYLTEKEMETK